MKNKRLYWLLSMVLMLSLFLAACNSGDDTEAQTDSEEDTTEDSSSDEGTETEENADGEPKQGGTLTYAIDSEPEGILNVHYYGTATDFEILQFMVDPLFTYDENLAPEPHLANWETEDNKTYTFKFEEGVKWHNGDELTVNDWVFALETLADPDYEGPRYSNVQTIEGAEAYNKGEADSISGIEVINDYEVKVTFDKARVNNLINIWSYPMNENRWKDVPVSEILGHEYTRTTPIGTGPFKMGKVVPGETYEFIANEDYFKGAPNLDKIIVKVIDNKAVSGALQNGEVDMVPVHPTLGEEVESMENVELVTYPGLSYYYVGFKLGVFDNEKKEIVEQKEKYQDKKLRKAMYHAINRQEWIDAFFSGYGSPVDAPVPSNHWIAADDSDLQQYEYDPEKAKSLLDEAGYKDTNDDGFREDPNGDEFVVNFSHYSSTNPTFEARAKALTQYWNDIGLQTTLEMIEGSLYYDKIEKDSDDIEVFYGGWSTGTDPDPTALWSSDALWNYTRWNNEKSDELLEKALDVEVVGTDKEKRQEIYTEWQQLANEELPMLYIAELQELQGINKRVGGVEYDVSGSNLPNEWYIKE
ncbi:oligopeptide ABC transporter substrate-binding protein [Pontibacillus yanchengensis]|uniref:Oligopeptide ABC transporter substrate-binding protein n=2 Tax=Pontibacillus yanchengensis TaxID=462910 RepID=A0ACC7VGQ8_9BACI|nr:oligopeptide ABC transporter substrate-binding protein [Pontibacillus yanchengensis]MYL32528.1 oligopeptide ABC transporter substrate-binding protein [Pontibacillus yanchengensis]MYL53109.1 oligopeptide ABC transporter substrate-binding protein [Pontibacillus yanchengensis]